MSDLLEKYDYLLKDSGPAAVVLKQWLKPVGGDVFFPPTYANPSQRNGDPPVYNIDRFEDAKHSVCVVDSIPSQANRIEPALGRIRDKDGKPIKLVPAVVVKARVGAEEQTVNLLEAGIALPMPLFSFLRFEMNLRRQSWHGSKVIPGHWLSLHLLRSSSACGTHARAV